MRLPPLAVLALAATGLLGSPASPAVAQEVRGQVRVEGSGEALDGALVTLVDAEDAAAARVLTDVFGRFRVRSRRPGRFRLRVDRLGHATVWSQAFDLPRGATVRRDVEAPVRPILLEGIDVAGEARCRVRPREGAAAARVWDEVRKALEVTEVTRAARAWRFDVEHVLRSVELDGEVIEEERIPRRVESSSPFGTPPPDSLVAGGFVRDSARTRLYFAPDAALLLSDAFLDSHCFGVRGGPAHGRRLGLAFEPLEGRDVPDVAGTLWLDGGGELRLLEYGYRNLPGGVADDRLGGEVRFTRLPDGSWIVRSWRIRMPVFGRRRRLAGFREEGAEVLRVLDARGTPVLEAGSATVWGHVLDSLGAAPVAGARVRLEGTGHGAVTGADGSFLFTGLEPARYRVRVRHDALDAVGHAGATASVDAPRGEARGVRILLPSRERALAETCARRSGRPDVAVAGEVVASDGRPADGARVELRWWSADGSEELAPGAATRAGALGRFVLCGVRGGSLLAVRAADGGGASSTVWVPVSGRPRPLFVRLTLAPG